MEKLHVACDLSESSLEDAANKLRYIRPHISVSRFGQADAKRLATLNCWSWGIDEKFDDSEWSLTINGQTVGSQGA